ncbi:MAG: hypothetical protein K8L99_31250 [Anaerolineae bacterium]|nr:hypothetical protein [Anaerolineae bacterium]
MPVFIGILILLVPAVVLIGWLGLQVKAPSFPSIDTPPPPDRIPLPADLPGPVLKHVRAIFGETMPEVQSAIVTGRAKLVFMGIPMPARFHFYYDTARKSHYHDIQVTWFKKPILRVHERFLDGKAMLDLPFGRVENDPYTNAAAWQGFWSETLAWVPAIVFATPQVRWEAIDDSSARMLLPNADDEEAFTVNFNADNGLMSDINTMRYADSKSGQRQTWTNHIQQWSRIGDQLIPTLAQTKWNDDPPWATWEIEQVVFNVDVSARFVQFGGDVSEL